MTLRKYRLALNASQEDVSRRTSLSINTYRRAEAGTPVSYTTAQEILSALNQLRREEGQGELRLEQLELNIV